MYLNGLMVGFSFALPYHVMRCATEAGVRVSVLGCGPAEGLRSSRCCVAFHRSSFSHDDLDYECAGEEIRSVAERSGAGVLFPSDDVSTRLLAALGPRLGLRTSALPNLDCFDALNNKWRFFELSRTYGVRTPQTRLFRQPREIRAALDSGLLSLPLTLKPANRSGAVGVHHILSNSKQNVLDVIDYTPILAQRHITGQEVGVNVVCDHGEIVAHAIQRREGRSFSLFEHEDLLENVTRLVRAVGLHGPANFDAIIEANSGLGYLLECNPRFWYTIYMSHVLGRNFVAMCLDRSQAEAAPSPGPGETSVRLNSALLYGLRTPWTLRRADWRMLRYHLSDPIPFWYEKRSMYDDREVAVPYNVMAGFCPNEAVNLVA